MAEPAFSGQPPDQNAAQADSGSTQAVHWPCLDNHPGPGNRDVPGTGSPHEDSDQNLHTELIQLRRAMQTRPTIDQACGVLMVTFGMSPQAAWGVLVMTSQNTNTKLHCVASDLVGTVRGDSLPKAVAEQLAAAVAKAKATPEAPGSAS